MTTTGKHTPTPWKADRHEQLRGHNGTAVNVWGLGIGWATRDEETEANSEFIIRAVNAHEHLVAALEEARERIAESIGDYGGILWRIEAALLFAKFGDQI